MIIGIDKIGFATSKYQLKTDTLALARGEDPEKYHQGLLLDALSITPITEDVVTLAADSALDILTPEDCASIDMVIFATESGIDQSKAAAVFVHGLLGIQTFARCIEMKEACYSATAAINYAKLHIEKHPTSKVLVLASDIAKYGINTPGEATQGAGAVAMLLSQNPRILSLDDDNVAQTRDIMDFWRPNYSSTPFVEGMYSTKQYLDCLKTTWKEHQGRFGSQLDDYTAFCFHIPFPKLAQKGLQKLLTTARQENTATRLKQHFEEAITYSKQIGNIYTGSLYLSFLSLLETSQDLEAGDKIGFFSYGSGAVCEIFSGRLVEGFKQHLKSNRLDHFNEREPLSASHYESLFYEEAYLDKDGNAHFEHYKTGPFALTEIVNHQRRYQKVDET